MNKCNKIGLWMYGNDGGDAVQHQLISEIESRGYCTISGFDLRNVVVEESHVYTETGFDLSSLNVLYHMNAEHRNEHQDTVLQALELAGVTLVNSYQSYRLTRDKFYANQILRQQGIRVAPSILLPTTDNLDAIKRRFKLWGSLLLKPRKGFCGQGIIKFDSFEVFYDYYLSMKRCFNNLYLEKYIPFDDRDYRVEIIGHDVVGGYSRRKTHAFKSNVSAGATLAVNSMDNDQINVAKKAVECLGLVTSIVDMIRCSSTGEL